MEREFCKNAGMIWTALTDFFTTLEITSENPSRFQEKLQPLLVWVGEFRFYLCASSASVSAALLPLTTGESARSWGFHERPDGSKVSFSLNNASH